MSSVFTLLFAPSFILLIRFYDFKTVTIIYIILAIMLFSIILITKKDYKELLTPSIYIILLSFAYFFGSFDTVKIIPVFISSIFFTLFLNATIQKKALVYSFTKRFYPKPLQDKEIKFLKKSDFYWAIVTFINTLIQLILVFYDNTIVWAFYSSVGWYILFFIALIAQIAYGKFYAINKMSS